MVVVVMMMVVVVAVVWCKVDTQRVVGGDIFDMMWVGVQQLVVLLLVLWVLWW